MQVGSEGRLETVDYGDGQGQGQRGVVEAFDGDAAVATPSLRRAQHQKHRGQHHLPAGSFSL